VGESYFNHASANALVATTDTFFSLLLGSKYSVYKILKASYTPLVEVFMSSLAKSNQQTSKSEYTSRLSNILKEVEDE
jgi:hypothetical protein